MQTTSTNTSGANNSNGLLNSTPALEGVEFNKAVMEQLADIRASLSRLEGSGKPAAPDSDQLLYDLLPLCRKNLETAVLLVAYSRLRKAYKQSILSQTFLKEKILPRLTYKATAKALYCAIDRQM